MRPNTSRSAAAARRLTRWCFCYAVMAQAGAASFARSEPSAAARGEPASGALTCMALRRADVHAGAAAGFTHMCRVLDKQFSRVSAEALLELRARASDAVAMQAFSAICAQGGPDVAALFHQAAELQSSGRRTQLHEVLAVDRPLAAALVAAAARVNAAFGGLYVGKLDCLRSTLCNPAFGLNSRGTCAACSITLKDATFSLRLRRTVQHLEAGHTAGVNTRKCELKWQTSRACRRTGTRGGPTCEAARVEATDG